MRDADIIVLNLHDSSNNFFLRHDLNLLAQNVFYLLIPCLFPQWGPHMAYIILYFILTQLVVVCV